MQEALEIICSHDLKEWRSSIAYSGYKNYQNYFSGSVDHWFRLNDSRTLTYNCDFRSHARKGEAIYGRLVDFPRNGGGLGRQEPFKKSP